MTQRLLVMLPECLLGDRDRERPLLLSIGERDRSLKQKTTTWKHMSCSARKRKKNCTILEVKAKALISCVVSAQLPYVFALINAQSRACEAVHIK